MKNLILLIAVMVIGACASMPTVKSVAGTYEWKEAITPRMAKNTVRLVILDNGIAEFYSNGKKDEVEHKWKLTKEGELHAYDPNGNIAVCRINKDGSITWIVNIYKDGKREDILKENQFTFKRIK